MTLPKTSKVYYYERASVFDRMLILLLGLACMVLVNMRGSCPQCPEYDKVLKAMKATNDQAADHYDQQQWSRKTTEGSSMSSSSESSYSGGSSEKKKHWSEKKYTSSDKKSSSSDKKSTSDKKSSGSKSSDKKHSSDKESSSSSGKSSNRDWTKKNFQETSKKKLIKKVDPDSKLPGYVPKDTLWQNKYDVVHIITTRYMQMQPDLIHLGKARNELFRVFTLPSIVAQTTQEFVWILFTDPDLKPEILDEVVEMIKPYKNILLLGMNNGMNAFRNPGWMTNIKTVFSGDYQMLKDYRVASKQRVLLETRIDADDSIFVEMVERVQSRAAKTMGERAKFHKYDPERIHKEYRIFCTEHHLEWGYFNPWEKSSKKGHLFGVSHAEFCISAGLTYGFQVGTDKDFLPTISHHRMSVEIPVCEKAPDNRNCLERIDAGDYKYIMLRSRTPTSAGMLGVIPTQKVVESETWKKQQDWAWDNVIEKNFAVKPDTIFKLRETLRKNMVNILTDALKGQCTKAEFTCKDSTKRDLDKLLAAVKANS